VYLTQMDPQHRSWKWQLENIIIFPPSHFQRTVDKIVESGPSDDRFRSTRSTMMSLLTCESAEAYYGVIRLLESKCLIIILESSF